MRFRTAGINWEGRRWTLAPSLVVLGEQINSIHPKPHPADGTVASRGHDAANPSSDHRPYPYSGAGKVRALDFGETVEDDVFNVLESIRLSRDPRVRYVIHERRMFSSYPSGIYAPFTWRPYSGPAPHDNHGHISTLADQDTDTRLWAIGGDMLTPDEEKFVKDMYRTVVEERGSNGTFAGYTVDHLRNHPSGGKGLTEEQVKAIVNSAVVHVE